MSALLVWYLLELLLLIRRSSCPRRRSDIVHAGWLGWSPLSRIVEAHLAEIERVYTVLALTVRGLVRSIVLSCTCSTLNEVDLDARNTGQLRLTSLRIRRTVPIWLRRKLVPSRLALNPTGQRPFAQLVQTPVARRARKLLARSIPVVTRRARGRRWYVRLLVDSCRHRSRRRQWHCCQKGDLAKMQYSRFQPGGEALKASGQFYEATMLYVHSC